MITAIVRFKLPAGVTREKAAELYRGSAPNYRDMPGLVRKYYLYGEGYGGGVYLWECREAADRVYTPAWRKMLAERYGATPEVTYLETDVIVDNQSKGIWTA